jgi:hypothetical protein
MLLSILLCRKNAEIQEFNYGNSRKLITVLTKPHLINIRVRLFVVVLPYNFMVMLRNESPKGSSAKADLGCHNTKKKRSVSERSVQIQTSFHDGSCIEKVFYYFKFPLNGEPFILPYLPYVFFCLFIVFI